MKNKLSRITPLALVAVLSIAGLAWATISVNAAPLTNTYLRVNRMATSTGTSMRLVFKTTGTGATSVSINMNGLDASSWTGQGGAVNATQTVSSASCATDSGATALPGTLAASGTGSTITITGVTALNTPGTTYCVDLTSAASVTTPSSAGEYHPVITVGPDNLTLATRIVTNDNVVISAVVPPTFNFVLSGNTDTFTANLAAGSVGITNGVTATVNTNAKNGWLAWAKGTNGGLTSAAAAKTIAATTPGTSATLSAGTEGYTMGVTAITQGTGQGTTSAVAAYDAQGAAHGSGLDTNYRQIASSNGSANGAVLTLKERSSISAVTPAASDYTDTMTLIGAGNF